MKEEEKNEESTQSQAEDGESTAPAADNAQNSEGLEAMREMINYIVRTLAHEPDDVDLQDEFRDGQTIFNLTVGANDKGRIIGKEGRTAQSIRSLLRVAGVKYGMRTRLEII